jgi:hypothetical protein
MGLFSDIFGKPTKSEEYSMTVHQHAQLSALQQHQITLSQQNAYIAATNANTTGGTGHSGQLGYLGQGGLGAGQYQVTYPATVTTAGQSVSQSYPMPSGLTVSIAFTDAKGLVWSLVVDQAYAGMLTAISQQHQYRYQGISVMPQQQPSKMLEGDFSEEEMDKAERVIEEMKQDAA